MFSASWKSFNFIIWLSLLCSFCVFLFRLTLVMAQSPVCGDMAPCCLSRQPPVATLPPPHLHSRWVFWLQVEEVFGIQSVDIWIYSVNMCTDTVSLLVSIVSPEGSQPEREAGRDGDLQRYFVQAGGHPSEILWRLFRRCVQGWAAEGQK